jgi:hypothetical protein
VQFVTQAADEKTHLEVKAIERCHSTNGTKTMNSESYERKISEIDSNSPVFNSFVAAMSLIAMAMAVLEVVL